MMALPSAAFSLPPSSVPSVFSAGSAPALLSASRGSNALRMRYALPRLRGAPAHFSYALRRTTQTSGRLRGRGGGSVALY